MHEEQNYADQDRLRDAADDPFHQKAIRKRLHGILHHSAAAVEEAHEETKRHGALDACSSEGDARPQHREGDGYEELPDEDARHVRLHVRLSAPELADAGLVGATQPDLVDEIVGYIEDEKRCDERDEDAFWIHSGGMS